MGGAAAAAEATGGAVAMEAGEGLAVAGEVVGAQALEVALAAEAGAGVEAGGADSRSSAPGNAQSIVGT